MLPGVLLLALVGWRDDRVSVSALVRLVVQFIVSMWLIGFGWWAFSFTGMLIYGVVVLAMIWLMNVYNFMDGSNGMAGFQGVFAGTVMAVLFQVGDQPAMALLSLVMAAACAGFIPLNFPNAKVFMGDVSSVPLGFMFASLAIYGIQTGSLNLPVFTLIMAVFLVDATLTLFARAIRGEQWYTAHAHHVYQRLIALGWSHRRVLVVYQAINVFLVLPVIVLATIYPQYAIAMTGLTIFVLVTAWYITNGRLGLIAEVRIK